MERVRQIDRYLFLTKNDPTVINALKKAEEHLTVLNKKEGKQNPYLNQNLKLIKQVLAAFNASHN